MKSGNNKTTPPILQVGDYRKLLMLYRGRLPLWDLKSLDRCVNAKLINSNGTALTELGRSKAERLAQQVERLQKGLPLSCRTVSRASAMEHDTWYVGEFVKRNVFFSSEALFTGLAPRGCSRIKVNWKNGLGYYRLEAQRIIEGRSWQKMVPYAIQIDEFGHLEFVCFQGLTDPSERRRIQSKYFDYVENRFKLDVSWWYKPKSPTSPVAAKLQSGGSKGLANKIVALIQPVAFAGAYPEIDTEG